MKKENNNFALRPLSSQDLESVVSLHLRAFPGFFLSFLGARFLREFYFSFLVDPTGRGFVAEDRSGDIIGVVVGSLDPEGYFRKLLKRRWWAFCAASLDALIRRPRVFPRLLRALFYRGDSPSGKKRALLSSIAVDPNTHRAGVGKALVEYWVKEIRNSGGVGCYLTTDEEDNEAVNAFYRKLGWKLETSYSTPEGRKINRYVFDF